MCRQSEGVDVTYLLLKGSIDDIMSDILEGKTQTVGEVVNGRKAMKVCCMSKTKRHTLYTYL